MKVLDGVTILTPVLIRRTRELVVMGILVAIQAGREFNLINRILACREMALIAFNRNVLPLERVLGCVMFLHAEQRRLPTIYCVAFCAFTLLWASHKLALVRIRFMAIHAIRKRDFLFEIVLRVAIHASDHGVLSEQRVLRLRMVELETAQQFLPARRRVALFAALLEGTLMRINMAIDAGTEFHVVVAHGPARHIRLVALLASDLDVPARQRIAGLRVIELFPGFPIREIVAAQAIVAEPPLVNVLVARYAILRKPEKRSIKILYLNKRPLRRDHISGCVAFLARQARMLSFQLVPRQAVIKLFL